ncbi:MAG TPA: metalloregulator ArsR/SmtB family transcription factor [Solirubrobacteraceae bacterium]|jgi:SAM-dependent methyltransferase|nr:metalloregulator ArsR/SmtB family transcription factor [Solirubrobacteraceae bacterium]
MSLDSLDYELAPEPEPEPVLNLELGFDDLVGALRAIAEPTRLRLVALLGREELTVTEIGRVIGQSQPRISRHLRLLVDGGVLERAPEGAFVYYRLAEESAAAELAHRIASVSPTTDAIIAADLAALSRVRQARIEAAIAYRSAHADELEALRELYVGEAAVERALLDMLVGEGPIGRLLDIGTGSGRILELLAPHTEQSVGLDVDHDMLQLARAALGEAQLSRAAVRHGDLHRPPFDAGSFDVAVMHHVLHLLDQPGAAITDAARLLRPGGRLLVADFATHELEDLRTVHGHRCLGIDDNEMLSWAVQAGLDVEDERTLAPTTDDEQLTVRLWLLRTNPDRIPASSTDAILTAGAAG